jgi:hypothetical protein
LINARRKTFVSKTALGLGTLPRADSLYRPRDAPVDGCFGVARKFAPNWSKEGVESLEPTICGGRFFRRYKEIHLLGELDGFNKLDVPLTKFRPESFSQHVHLGLTVRQGQGVVNNRACVDEEK